MTKRQTSDWIIPDWPAPEQIFACATTRRGGGVSDEPFDDFNLAAHVEDDTAAVAHNRELLHRGLQLPSQPQWLEQVHGNQVVELERDVNRRADAGLTRQAGTVAVVMTADCLPVLFCNRAGTEVAAAHAGWRGLAGGVLEATVQQFRAAPAELLAWLGPAIGPQHFEVGEEVQQAFTQPQPDDAMAFIANRPGHYLADLYALAKARLKRLGVGHISGGEFCTYAESERFFSYRRESRTGRQASLIYIKKT